MDNKVSCVVRAPLPREEVIFVDDNIHKERGRTMELRLRLGRPAR